MNSPLFTVNFDFLKDVDDSENESALLELHRLCRDTERSKLSMPENCLANAGKACEAAVLFYLRKKGIQKCSDSVDNCKLIDIEGKISRKKNSKQTEFRDVLYVRRRKRNFFSHPEDAQYEDYKEAAKKDKRLKVDFSVDGTPSPRETENAVEDTYFIVRTIIHELYPNIKIPEYGTIPADISRYDQFTMSKAMKLAQEGHMIVYAQYGQQNPYPSAEVTVQPSADEAEPEPASETVPEPKSPVSAESLDAPDAPDVQPVMPVLQVSEVPSAESEPVVEIDSEAVTASRRNWRIPAAVFAAALILVLVCVGLLHDRAPVVAPVSADELVLSAQEGNADLPVVELSVGECVLDTDTVYSLSSDTQISVLVTNKSKAKGIWFSYGDGNPERLSGTSFTLPDPGSDRTWHPLYVYYQMEDGTEVGKDKSYKISLCEDSNDYDSPLLVSVNGQQLIPNNSSAYPIESDWAVCVQPRKGFDVSGFSYSFGGAEQKCLLDGYEVIYPPLQNGGELTLTVTPELAGVASQKLSYRLSFAEKGITEDDSLPGIVVRTSTETLQVGKMIEMSNNSRTLYLTVPEDARCEKLCYKIGTRAYETVEGNICSVEIPEEYAGTGPFTFYVWYYTEDNVRKPWVLYNMNMSKVLPHLDVSVRENHLAEDKTYIIYPEDIVTVQIDSEKEDWTLHYKIGTAETEHISGGNRWDIAIPARLTNTGAFSFYVCYENGDGVRSEWLLYVLSAEE